jgi:hypothetical protein
METEQLAPGRHFGRALPIARIYAALGDKDQAFAFLSACLLSVRDATPSGLHSEEGY